MDIIINGWVFKDVSFDFKRIVLNGAADMNCSITRKENGFINRVEVHLIG